LLGPHGTQRFGEFFIREMEREAAEHEGVVFVADDGGRLVGFAGGGVRVPDHKGDELNVVLFRNGRVTELYVEPGSRRRGTARALMEAIERHFRNVRCGAVRIEVFAPNVGARAFYERGYEPRDIDLFKLL
jgi:GNAT superfamily N-acetyltransferase